MKLKHLSFLFGLLLLMGSSVLFSCKAGKGGEVFSRDWDEIEEHDTLLVLMENSASTFYDYQGVSQGFDYELMRTFCDAQKIHLKVVVMDNVDSMFQKLNKGEADVIASNITQTTSRDQEFLFSTPLYTTKQVVVQRWADVNLNKKYKVIRDTTALDSLTISVHRYSSFFERLTAMERTMGKDLDILEAPGKYSADDLVRLVAEGKIEATVTDASLAGILVEEYPNLQFDLPLTVPEPIGWVMRKNAPKLKEKMDEWLSKERVQILIKQLRKKYFKANTTHVALFHADVIMPKIKGNQISPYDSLFKKEAKAINWDWRMLAALCYQESNFDPTVVSSHGAFGLMQLMPETASKYGCDSTDLVAGNIHAAAQLLKEVDRSLRKRVPNPEERMKFVLASYNAGLGHVFDAMVIARHLNMPDTVWFGQVENALLMKSQREYYTLPGTKSGYCRCQETYHFVDRVLSFYDHFKKKVK
ncbi:MAG: hypothetical protein RL362_1055 [Bacteroidota bacterium]